MPKFPYSSLPGTQNLPVLMPMLPIALRYGESQFLTYALVDSGATSGIIATVIAETLHINWQKIPSKIGYSLSGGFRFHPVELELEIGNNNFPIQLNIVEGISPYQCILGQADLFQKAKIAFERYKREFEITFRRFN